MSLPEEMLAGQLEAALIPYIREYRFHPVRKWRFDFVLLEQLIAIEINGGIYTRGRHARGYGLLGDYEKLNEAQLLGWWVLQFSPTQVRRCLVLPYLERAIRIRQLSMEMINGQQLWCVHRNALPGMR